MCREPGTSLLKQSVLMQLKMLWQRTTHSWRHSSRANCLVIVPGFVCATTSHFKRVRINLWPTSWAYLLTQWKWKCGNSRCVDTGKFARKWLFTSYQVVKPSGFSVLVGIRAFVIYTSLGLLNESMKRTVKRILVIIVKWRHHAKAYCLKIQYYESYLSITCG